MKKFERKTMMKKIIIVCCSLFLAGGGSVAGHASETGTHSLPNMDWSFEGMTGTYDRGALQRGFQIYREVCSSCHSMNRVYFRNLEALGYNEEEIKAFAAEAYITDGPNEEGEMFEREGKPSDAFPSPFPNKETAMYANNGAVPPDMSLLVKARHGGADYIYALLNGYEDAPAGVHLMPGQYYNKYMNGNVLAMAPPLMEGLISYEDGSPETMMQYAKDVATFLAWASEPQMEARKRVGFKALFFLFIFAGLMYGVKRKIWADAH